MRVLVAYEEAYLSYRDAIVQAMKPIGSSPKPTGAWTRATRTSENPLKPKFAELPFHALE